MTITLHEQVILRKPFIPFLNKKKIYKTIKKTSHLILGNHPLKII